MYNSNDKIEFEWGYMTPLAGAEKDAGTVFKKICVVWHNDEQLHPVVANNLAINHGYNSLEDMLNHFPEDKIVTSEELHK